MKKENFSKFHLVRNPDFIRNIDFVRKIYSNFRIFIFPAVVAISSLILIVFVISPQTIKLFQNQKVQGELQEKSKFLEAKAVVLEGLDEDNLKQKLGYALTAYPQEQDFANALGIIQEIAGKNGFNVTEFAVRLGSERSESSQKYGIKLEASGAKVFFPRFISAIESSARMMEVGNLEISPAREGDIVNVSVEISVLYAPSPSSFGGPESPLPELSKADEELLTELVASGISRPAQQLPSQPQPRGKANPFE
ncbi:MAG: type 4a pilus biogenesis protein PilO [Patescibacteria group bacterium]